MTIIGAMILVMSDNLTSRCVWVCAQGPLLKEYMGMRGAAQLPQYLQGVSSSARIEVAALWRFEALLEHSGNIAGIRGAVLNLSGDLELAPPCLYYSDS